MFVFVPCEQEQSNQKHTWSKTFLLNKFLNAKMLIDFLLIQKNKDNHSLLSVEYVIELVHLSHKQEPLTVSSSVS